MNAAQLTEALLRQYDVRVLPATAEYVLKHQAAAPTNDANGGLPVMGVQARTGVPVRMLIDLRRLVAHAAPSQHTSATQQRQQQS